MEYEGVSLCSYSNTRSKELIDSFHKLGWGSATQMPLYYGMQWTLHDLDCCSVCPDAIDEGRDSQVSVLSTLLALTALT